MKQNVKPTKLEDATYKKPTAILGILLGVFLIFPTSIVGFAMLILPGILLILLGIFVIVESVQGLRGRYKAICPYCGRKRVIQKGTTAFKCVSCRKVSKISDGYAVPMD